MDKPIQQYFLALYPKKGSETQQAIDGIRLIAYPRIKHNALITIRGPFKDRVNLTEWITKTEFE